MPYITQASKRDLAQGARARDAGELNYAITRLLVQHVEMHGLCYATINDVVGAVEGAKAEFQRRVVAPYEDTKVLENGDVYSAPMAKAIERNEPKVPDAGRSHERPMPCACDPAVCGCFEDDCLRLPGVKSPAMEFAERLAARLDTLGY